MGFQFSFKTIYLSERFYVHALVKLNLQPVCYQLVKNDLILWWKIVIGKIDWGQCMCQQLKSEVNVWINGFELFFVHNFNKVQ